MKVFFACLIVLSLLAVPLMADAKPVAKQQQTQETKAGFFDLFSSKDGKGLINVVIILTVLSFVPAVLLLMSSFTRIVVVLSFIRQAIGVPQLPPNQVIIGLSLFLTFFVMAPTYERMYTNSFAPYMENRITLEQFLDSSAKDLSVFMLKHTKEKDLALFFNAAKMPRPKSPEEVPMKVLVPAFAISELKRAFQIGFLLYVPFLVIDMVVASVLLSAGMMMLPPVFISLPFKIMLFVLADGWNLLVGSII